MQADPQVRNKSIWPGSDLYYALLFVPREQREACNAIHALCTEINGVVDQCSDAGIARLKLQWWRDEIHRTYAHQPQHPATRALHTWLSRYNIPEEYLHELIDGSLMDLDRHDYAEFSELALYCHRVSGSTQLMVTEILGYDHHRTPRYASDLGIALKLMDLICSLHHAVQHGRNYLPRDEMREFDVDRQSLLRRDESEALRQLLASQANRARHYVRRAISRLPDADRARQSPGLILAAIAQSRLDEIQADGFRVLSRKTDLTPIRKLWIAWRTARRARRAGAPDV
jgi:phytoene synthase